MLLIMISVYIILYFDIRSLLSSVLEELECLESSWVIFEQVVSQNVQRFFNNCSSNLQIVF